MLLSAVVRLFSLYTLFPLLLHQLLSRALSLSPSVIPALIGRALHTPFFHLQPSFASAISVHFYAPSRLRPGFPASLVSSRPVPSRLVCGYR